MILISANDTKSRAEEINHFRARFNCVRGVISRKKEGTEIEKSSIAVDVQMKRIAFNQIGIDL
jgi:hypothetical protein